ncbi:MAG: 1-acyl-sn-glycerol-3-phosphate acyltransferase [Pelobium sp.]
MMYFFFYHLLKITCKVYFKRINIYHSENIPATDPLIICGNHGNSFMDAILMAVIFKRKLHFLARADAFNTPFKNWFLSKINMMPIYRIRDGREGLKNNDAIFDRCKEILAKNGAILIFPEGNCIVEKRLREFKTGFVHLVYESEAKNLKVLPVSINYSHPHAFYTEVSFEFSTPISVQEIKSDLKFIPFSKILVEMVNQKISGRMITIPKPEDDEFYEQVFTLVRNEELNDLKFTENQIKKANDLNQLKEGNRLLFNEIKNKIDYYFKLLYKYELNDKVMKSYTNSDAKLSRTLLFPFYFLGYIFNYIPSFLIKNKIEKKIKEPQFLSAVRMVAGMFIYLIYIPLLMIFLGLLIGSQLMSAIIIIGIFVLYYLSFEKYKRCIQLKKLNFHSEMCQELFTKRAELIALLNL